MQFDYSLCLLSLGIRYELVGKFLRNLEKPFSASCPLKAHIYLDKPAAFSCINMTV